MTLITIEEQRPVDRLCRSVFQSAPICAICGLSSSVFLRLSSCAPALWFVEGRGFSPSPPQYLTTMVYLLVKSLTLSPTLPGVASHVAADDVGSTLFAPGPQAAAARPARQVFLGHVGRSAPGHDGPVPQGAPGV